MKHITIALTAVVAMAVASPSDAATIVPGASCMLQNPSATRTDVTGVQWTSFGGIKYKMPSINQQELFVCGLPRRTDSLSGNVYFRVRNQDSNALSCIFWSLDGAGDVSDFVSVSTNATGASSLSASTSGLTVYTTGKYAADCTLWGGDVIESIRYSED